MLSREILGQPHEFTGPRTCQWLPASPGRAWGMGFKGRFGGWTPLDLGCGAVYTEKAFKANALCDTDTNLGEVYLGRKTPKLLYKKIKIISVSL